MFDFVINGLKTLMGTIEESVAQVCSGIRKALDKLNSDEGHSEADAETEISRCNEKLRNINDEIMQLRNKVMADGALNPRDKSRWHALKTRREQAKAELRKLKERQAGVNLVASEDDVENITVTDECSHIIQFNAFADAMGKNCPKCKRPMKLQWKREVKNTHTTDFFWACTGWYEQFGQSRACTYTERMQKSDFGLITDTSAPEFQLSTNEFGIILSDRITASKVKSRIIELKGDLNSDRKGVHLATCPTHGLNLVLKEKASNSGLLDSFFLACPNWEPHNKGCAFMEKLKSGAQLAALLKSETGRGIL